MTSCYLPINMNNETHLTFQLVMLLRNDLYPWFYENFINIFIHGEERTTIEFVDNVGESFSFLIDETITHDYKYFLSLDNPIAFIKERISNGFYTAIWVDKYYIPGAIEQADQHFVHPIFIYGYDDSSNCFAFVNFSWDKGIVKNDIKYDDLLKAVQSVQKYYIYGGGDVSINRTMYCFRQKADYARKPFSITAFNEELKNYIYSNPGDIKARYQWYPQQNAIYGLKVYDRFIYVLNHIQEGYYIVFKSIGDFVLHKQYMYARLTYIMEQYDLPEECCLCIKSFSRVVRLIESIKMLNIKYAIRDKTIPAALSLNPEFLQKAVQILSDARQLEYKLLPEIYQYLSDTILYHKNTDNIEITSHVYSIRNDCACIEVKLNSDEFIKNIDFNITQNTLQLIPHGTLVLADGEEYMIPELKGKRGRAYTLSIIPKKISGFAYYLPNICMDIKEMITLVPNGLIKSYIWYFNKGTSDGWGPAHDIKRSEIGTQLICWPADRDPNIVKNNFHINGDIAKYVYIKYGFNYYNETAQIFFSTSEAQQFSEDKSKIFAVCPGSSVIEYIVDMSDQVSWKGDISSLRFDPSSYELLLDKGLDSKFFIDYIEVSDRMPEYNSLKQFCGSQGINGWFYYTYDNGITYREMNYNDEGEKYINLKCPSLFIDKMEQTSCNHIASVRKFVAQASGIYSIHVKLDPQTPNCETILTIRKNHKIVKVYSAQEFHEVLLQDYIEHGESFGFEYYNNNANTVENIHLEVDITKISDSSIES